MPTPHSLASCRDLVIHADPVLGSTLASACEHRGAPIAGIHREAEAALQALAFHGLAHHNDLLAILDAEVPDAPRIAQRLAEGGVPYLVLADAGNVARNDVYAAAILKAPVNRVDLMGAVTSLCRALGRE